MIYLIAQLSVWLLLTAAFAALAGWAFAAQRAAPRDHALRREREHLLRDIARIAGGELAPDTAADERELDATRRLIEVRDGRIAELERALENVRARADEAASRIAELERAPPPAPAENEELQHLRALVSRHEEERSREVEVAAEPVERDDETETLLAWRLRYFEHRVRYLEDVAARKAEAPTPQVEEAPVAEWRAREAEARAAFLENELRALNSGSAGETEPFAANAEIDMLMRWRLLYLERRVSHLQGRLAERPTATPAAPEPAAAAEPDPDRWKWRARYLEARMRHLEQRAGSLPPQPPQAAAPAEPAPVETQARPTVRAQKPATLPAARNGAPDDFTLIEDVSVLQQTTLYSLGVFHFDQIAAWSAENVAWVDQYLRLRGRIDDEQWVEQAQALAQRGVGAARRTLETENV